MRIIYTKSYEKTYKKIKKHVLEYNNLLKILDIIENVDTFNELLNLPIAKMYGFEQLKYENNEFYSFNLNKNKGVIRLIVKPKDNYVELYLVMISYKRYKDFNAKGVIFYE